MSIMAIIFILTYYLNLKCQNLKYQQEEHLIAFIPVMFKFTNDYLINNALIIMHFIIHYVIKFNYINFRQAIIIVVKLEDYYLTIAQYNYTYYIQTITIVKTLFQI